LTAELGDDADAGCAQLHDTASAGDHQEGARLSFADFCALLRDEVAPPSPAQQQQQQQQDAQNKEDEAPPVDEAAATAAAAGAAAAAQRAEEEGEAGRGGCEEEDVEDAQARQLEAAAAPG
jgi:hypothetical protein